MTKVSQLPLITSPEQFFDTDKILLVDIFRIDKSCNPILANAVKLHPNAFTYAGELYYPYAFMGSPENMFLNAKKGIPYCINGLLFAISWGGDLKEALASKKVYDFSDHYHMHKEGKAEFAREPQFIIDRYVLPALQSSRANISRSIQSIF